MRRLLPPIQWTRSKIDIAGFFGLAAVCFGAGSMELGIVFMAIGAVVFLHDNS